MKPESKRVPKTHTYSHRINSSNSKLEKTASCFDFSKLLKALNVAQEEVTIGAVVDNSINASSSSNAINNAANQEGTASTSTTYDLSKLSRGTACHSRGKAETVFACHSRGKEEKAFACHSKGTAFTCIHDENDEMQGLYSSAFNVSVF